MRIQIAEAQELEFSEVVSMISDKSPSSRVFELLLDPQYSTP